MSTTHQTFIAHYLKAAAWVRYNNTRGFASERQILRVMRQLTDADLTRMLTERGIRWMADYKTRKDLREKTLAIGR